MSQPPRSQRDFDRLLATSAALVEKLRPALRRHDRARIVDLIGRLVEGEAPLGGQWRQLARIAADQGEIGLARRAIGQFVTSASDTPAARFEQFDLLAATGALGEARDLLHTLPRDVPDPATNAYSRGAVAVFLGEQEEARRALDEVTAAHPAMGQAWLALATLVDFAAEPDLARAIAAARDAIASAPPDQQAVYCYALGKAHADLGEHAQAFAAFAQGARIRRSQLRHDRALVAAKAEEAMRGWSAEAIDRIAARQEEPTGRTIFVTGSPRSGTTLVEQILTSHGDVADGAEINKLLLLGQEIGGLDFASLAAHVEEHGTAPAARLWDHWLDERFATSGRVVDKSTDAGFFLGLAAALLPEAPLIWVTRDPLDCAWSCFRTHFYAGLDWSYDLEDIACHFRVTDRLLAHWRGVLGDRLLVVPYEELVTAPDEWTRRILAHCGLAEEEQVFAPHENRRAVTTSSVMQVRRPINRTAVGAAEPYREWLGPFLRAYQD